MNDTPRPSPPLTRIVVTGPECTGKTTLARELAVRLGTWWVPEFSRAYAVQVGRELTARDVEPIARGQIAAEDSAMERLRAAEASGCPPVLVLDTDLVSTVVYANHYYGHCPEWIAGGARARRAELYLLGDIDIAWAPDGVRDRPLAREEMLGRFREQLAAIGAGVRIVSGHGPARLAHALDAVFEELPALAARSPEGGTEQGRA